MIDLALGLVTGAVLMQACIWLVDRFGLRWLALGAALGLVIIWLWPRV